ncbi:DNA primase [Candidatus Pseudothioglobus singularis]|jgi:DNA primase|uniref:DNA primase n=1 Tax=Candidatus Pseudothioglobus singularis TaxID=1427364 RepID=UPI00036F9B01|nr:DNA primase [Candidatus Pseudothioglobus singularis]ANQ66184.1 DNA primase [Candidatus Pseudothioglobus singularis]MDB4822862.1 DNA primase [Candidatus Pseudothioglobus singularis]MDC1066200.1 DNA primase [Candidatus Pseudothioglobus singularis]
MPFVDRDFINDLPNRVDIVGLINKRVALKKAGKDYKACCPFHEEKTPSFTVVPTKQIYHCFGCGESGGIIDFIMKYDHLAFVEAIETVAGESGISVVYDQTAKPVDMRFKRYNKLMEELSSFYQEQLKTSAAKKKVVDYAKNRGVSGSIAKRFELGFAPPGWTNLFDAYKDSEESTQDLLTMGMIVPKKDKKDDYYDRFRDRLMFPIHNTKGSVIGFGGRVLSSKDNPKYLNSPETPLFSKSKELYGLYHCRKYSRKIDAIIVVEGYMDVIALHQQGITNVVATLGTATTSSHLQVLSRTAETIVFCFDGDKAGRDAAWKALQTSLPAITAGLVIKFLLLPEGEDPDTLINSESAKAFNKRVDEAQTLSNFLFEHIKAEVPFNTIEGKTLFLEKSAALVNLVSYPIYQQQLIEGIAQTIGQNITQVEKAIEQNIANNTQHYYANELEQAEIVNQSFQTKPKRTSPSSIKSLMSRMISCVINYPSLVNDPETSSVIEERARKLPKSDVLVELIRHAQVESDLSKEALLLPYKSKERVYNRLKELSVMEPFLSEYEAKEEFGYTLTAAEKFYERKSTKASILSAKTHDEEKAVMQDIMKSKVSATRQKKS